MMYLKLPPKIKVLEAISAIADNRIKILNDYEAIVESSDRSRVYRVYVNLSSREVDSTDNGTRLRNYVGYPIIAFLMIKGVLPLDKELLEYFKGIPWKKLNEEFKSYEKVLNYIKSEVESKGLPFSKVEKYMTLVLNKLKMLNLKKINKY